MAVFSFSWAAARASSASCPFLWARSFASIAAFVFSLRSLFNLDRVTADQLDTAVTVRRSKIDAALIRASVGLRRHQRQSRSVVLTGRARIGSPIKKRCKSFANASAEVYRFAGSFCKHLRQI